MLTELILKSTLHPIKGTIKRIKDKGDVRVDFNIKGVNEIVELSNQRKKSEKLMDELFEE